MNYPTAPSRLTSINFCASTANSIGSFLNTLLQNPFIIKEIASFNQNINAKNKNGYTALQKAVMSAKNTEIIKYLITLGANKKVTTEFNETVFDLASENEALKNTDLKFLKI